jgi:beta-lactamase superfamily II metal-dependent hydrolase
VVGFLRSQGVATLDGIVVSNPGADHMGGFLGRFDAFEVSTLYLSDGPKETVIFSAFLHNSVGDEGSEVVESRRDADGVGRHAGGCYRPSYAQALLGDQR